MTIEELTRKLQQMLATYGDVIDIYITVRYKKRKEWATIGEIVEIREKYEICDCDEVAIAIAKGERDD